MKEVNFYKLSETEEELMNVIWEQNRSFRSTELLDFFNREKGKQWKSQTLTTFLTRLVDKGMLDVKKDGRSNVYIPLLSIKEYRKREAQSVLDRMYKGSVRNFLASLYDEKVPPDEMEELKKWFSDK